MNILKEFSTFFLSEVLSLGVFDHSDRNLGSIDDVAVDISHKSSHPFVSAFIIRRGGADIMAVPYNSIVEYRPDYFKLASEPSLREVTINADGDYEGVNELLLKRDILDKQIVDTSGMKIVRVNDIKLTFVKDGVVVIGADIGLSGLLRRLSIERPVKFFASMFKKKLPDSLISWRFVEPIGVTRDRIMLSVEYDKLSLLHPADIADIMEDLSVQEGSEILEKLDDEIAADAISQIDESELQVSLIESLNFEKAADILEEMAPDEVADILGDIDTGHAEKILSDMNEEGAKEIRELMSHDENTAGGLMTTEYISFPEYFTAEQALSEFRLIAPDTEMTVYLYIEDREGRLSGVLSLERLVVAKPSQILSDIMTSKVVSVIIDETQEDVAKIMSKYDLLAIPVVDMDCRMEGIITLDDVLEILMEEKERIPHFLRPVS
jgi:magnesium transporter